MKRPVGSWWYDDVKRSRCGSFICYKTGQANKPTTIYKERKRKTERKRKKRREMKKKERNSLNSSRVLYSACTNAEKENPLPAAMLARKSRTPKNNHLQNVSACKLLLTSVWYLSKERCRRHRHRTEIEGSHCHGSCKNSPRHLTHIQHAYLECYYH